MLAFASLGVVASLASPASAQVKQNTVTKDYGNSLAGGTVAFTGYSGVSGGEAKASGTAKATIKYLNKSKEVVDVRLTGSSKSSNAELHLEAVGKTVYHKSGYGSATYPQTTWSVFGNNPPSHTFSVGVFSVKFWCDLGAGAQFSASEGGSSQPSAQANGAAQACGFGQAGVKFSLLGGSASLSGSADLAFANTTLHYSGSAKPGNVTLSCSYEWLGYYLKVKAKLKVAGVTVAEGTLFNFSGGKADGKVF